jgi:hypothetical protein
MGNLIGKDENTLNFKGLKTENISTTIPYLNKLQNDAKHLAQQLDNKNFTESENQDMYKLFEKNNQQEDEGDTSPFISSEMYKYLVKNYKTTTATSDINTEIQQYMNNNFSATSVQPQNGGASVTENFNLTATPSLDQQIYQYLNRNQQGGGDESSSTVEEKTIEMSDESMTEEELRKKMMRDLESSDMSMDGKTESPEMMTGGSEISLDSYLSSSAHSDGIDTLTVGEGAGYLSDSVNTDDINIISVE